MWGLVLDTALRTTVVGEAWLDGLYDMIWYVVPIFRMIIEDQLAPIFNLLYTIYMTRLHQYF